MTKPLVIDLFCGLGGWTDGLLAEGYDVIGFDIEQHVYGVDRYPAQLVVQDALTLDGGQFQDASLIVASPPCQFFSYTAMPWSKGKALAAAVRADPVRLAVELALFAVCFRLQREAILAAGRRIPMVVENVRGAQPWVGRARWSYGSFFLWGDVPALMPPTRRHDGEKSVGPSWAAVQSGHWTNPAEAGRKNGNDWFGAGDDCSAQRRHGSKSTGRKRATAEIAKIPLLLSRHIGAVYHPDRAETTSTVRIPYRVSK